MTYALLLFLPEDHFWRSRLLQLLWQELRRKTLRTRTHKYPSRGDVLNLGHSRGRPRTTNDIYTHVEVPMLRPAMQKLEMWLVEQRKEDDEQQTTG
jgi:hypothetical protein